MKIFDLHQDLMLHMLAYTKYAQNEQTSWGMLECSPVDLVVATAFPDPDSGDQTDPIVVAMIDADIARYRAYLEEHADIWTVATSTLALTDTRKKLLLHIEGLNVFLGTDENWQKLESWYKNGLRSIGMWWNIENKLGGGTNTPKARLTSLGHEVMEWIEENNLVLDLAHAGRATFFDVAEHSTRPLYVSHGNVDALCPSIRNYTDQQLRLIAESGGVIGVFFSNTYTVGKEIKGSVDDLIRHIVYIKKLIGIDHIALGSDFGTGTIEKLSSVADFEFFITKLQKSGFTETEITAIYHKNAERVLSAHLC